MNANRKSVTRARMENMESVNFIYSKNQKNNQKVNYTDTDAG